MAARTANCCTKPSQTAVQNRRKLLYKTVANCCTKPSQTAVQNRRKLLYGQKMTYIERAVDTRLERLLSSMGGVLIEGPRACGKTSTGLQHAKSSIRLDESPTVVQLAELDPQAVLQGDTPRLIDEWQLAPFLWNIIRHEIDDRQARGQFILSGSAAPTDDIRRHSGAGRFARLRMRPMTLTESRPSTAQVSLSSLSASEQLTGVHSDLTYKDLAAEAVRGGWPALTNESIGDAMDFNASYCADLTSTDLQVSTGIRHDPVRMRRLMESLARNTATEATSGSLASDVAADGSGIDRNTIRIYLDSLSVVCALEEQPAWAVSLRSRTRLRKAAKIHFCDPSLACASLHLSADRLAQAPEFFGQIFESMAVRDLLTYLNVNGGHLYHYRDETGLEVDAIAEFADGGWAAIEIKLGSSAIPMAEANLIKLRDQRVDTGKIGSPRFLAVITGTEYGYTLPSGVHVIPLATLGA